MYAEILLAIKKLALQYASPYTTISNGAMPVADGLAMYIGSGAETERHFDNGGMHEISIVLNGKHSDLNTVLTALSNIHYGITNCNYINTPSLKADKWQVTSISTTSIPNHLGREDTSKQWLCGSILRVAFYLKRR